MRESTVFLSLVMIAAIAVASSMTDIDYSQSLQGTGTVISDYKMGSAQSTEASGKVRGTGEVMKKYLFSSNNGSENVTIEDLFVLSEVPTIPKIILADYPQRPKKPDKFRLIGAAWASGIEVSGPGGGGDDQNRESTLRDNGRSDYSAESR